MQHVKNVSSNFSFMMKKHRKNKCHPRTNYETFVTFTGLNVKCKCIVKFII